MAKVSTQLQTTRTNLIKGYGELSQSDFDSIFMDAIGTDWRDPMGQEMVCRLLAHILKVDSTITTDNVEAMVKGNQP
jgi:hypothetical protein